MTTNTKIRKSLGDTIEFMFTDMVLVEELNIKPEDINFEYKDDFKLKTKVAKETFKTMFRMGVKNDKDEAIIRIIYKWFHKLTHENFPRMLQMKLMFGGTKVIFAEYNKSDYEVIKQNREIFNCGLKPVADHFKANGFQLFFGEEQAGVYYVGK